MRRGECDGETRMIRQSGQYAKTVTFVLDGQAHGSRDVEGRARAREPFCTEVLCLESRPGREPREPPGVGLFAVKTLRVSQPVFTVH